jgi:hypothetical protein
MQGALCACSIGYGGQNSGFETFKFPLSLSRPSQSTEAELELSVSMHFNKPISPGILIKKSNVINASRLCFREDDLKYR